MKIVKNLKSIIIVISIFVFLTITYIISTTFFEPKAYNFMVSHFTANKYGSDDIVAIVIDDDSLAKIRWPWKRELYAKIFNYLRDYSTAKLVGFDAIIATPDVENPQSDKIFFDSISSMDNLVVGFVPLTAPYKQKDAGLIYDKNFKQKFYLPISDERSRFYQSTYQSLSMFPGGYYKVIDKVGSVITSVDFDGYIRSIDQFINYKGTLYPSFSFKMFSALHPDAKIIVKNDKILIPDLKMKIPAQNLNNGIYNNIHYYKLRPHSSYSHKTYSAIDIMDSYDAIKKGQKPKISPQLFENKIVLVGANAKAIGVGLEDVKRTPVSNDHPGVDIQATNLDNILNNEFITLTSGFTDFVYLIFLLGVTFLVIRYFSLFMSFGIISIMMISFVAVTILCYRFNLAINVITPLTLQILMMTIAYSYRFILEGQNKEKIKHAMGKYISQDVMQNVVKNIDGIKLGGKRANVTVLFADIRGFTSMSEKMSAEEVSVILNEYFTEIEPIISKYNGVINKFIGDAVMAIFGEPIQDKDHAQNAVRCANEIFEKLEILKQKWIKEGKPKIEIGVGINTGEAFVGNIGSEKRLEYTVIGDMVNLASRIESYNKVYKTRFLISAFTYEKVRNIVDVIKISEVTIRGKAKKLNIYEVLRLVK